MTSDSAIQVCRLSQVAEMAPLRQAWNALAGGVVFRSFDWLEGWWRAYADTPRNELLALAAFDQTGQLVGIAPWYVERSASRSVIRFLGSGEVCSDYLTVLSQPGREDAVTGALADWLCRPGTDERTGHVNGAAPRWDLLDLGSVHAADRTLSRFVAQMADRGHFVHRRSRTSCWRVALPGCWNDYLATLSKSHRKQLRRLDRTYFASGRARLNVVTRLEELPNGLDLLATLHQRRQKSMGGRGCFASSRFAAFHLETAERLLQSGHLRLSWLELDGQVVAVEYQVTGDGVVYAYQSGIEPSALAHQPGRLITLSTMRQAIADGYHAFDFLRGDEAYKAHWRAQPRPTEDVRIISDTLRGKLRHGLWLASGNVKQLIKRGWIHSSSHSATKQRPVSLG
jgi:CelD/BcsL family acetyltransferase involved in cellulose biosynthesis